MSMTEGRRPQRVAEAIKKHVADALAKDVFDPRLSGLMLTRVEVGADLALARVYVRKMSGEPSAEQRQQIETAANRAAIGLRRSLAPRLGLRRMPELRFHYDSGQDAIDRIETLLGEIERERGPE
jgi:ribosome-binding factor A